MSGLTGYLKPNDEESKGDAAEEQLLDKDAVIKQLKENISQSEDKIRSRVGTNYYNPSFPANICISIKEPEVISKFFGPYKVLQRISKVVYKLELPIDNRIHLIFHFACLKKMVGDAVVTQSYLPPIDDERRIKLEPIAVLDRRMVKRINGPVTQVLVEWSHSFRGDATWG
ncbi:hypothetical protein WN943_000177 [Citrus x changshan-huyou]